MPGFAQILVANRGEIASRFIRACRDAGIGFIGPTPEAIAQSLGVSLRWPWRGYGRTARS